MFHFLSLGLDIQPHKLFLLQLRKTGKKIRVEQSASFSLPEEISCDGKIQEWEALHGALNPLVKKMGLAGTATAIHVPSHLVRIQQIQLPEGLSDEAIHAEINMQLERDFPGLQDELAIDFHVESQQRCLQVDFVVSRKEYISQYVSCVNSTGLKVKIVDVDCYALERARCSPAVISEADYQIALGLAMREMPC